LYELEQAWTEYKKEARNANGLLKRHQDDFQALMYVVEVMMIMTTVYAFHTFREEVEDERRQVQVLGRRLAAVADDFKGVEWTEDMAEINIALTKESLEKLHNSCDTYLEGVTLNDGSPFCF